MVARTGRTYRTIQGDEVNAPRVAGGNADVRMMAGLDGVVSSVGAAAQEIQNAAKELRILNQRTMQMYGQSASSEGVATAGVTQRGLTDSLAAAINEQTKVLLARLPASHAAPAPGPQAASGGVPNAPGGGGRRPTWADDPNNPYQEDPRDRPRTPPPVPPPSDWLPSPATAGPTGFPNSGGLAEPEPGQREQADRSANWGRLTHNRDYFGGKGKFSIAELRKDLGNQVGKAMDNRTFGPQLAKDPQDEWRHATGVEGEFGDYATPEEVAKFEKHNARIGALRGGVQALGEGATLRQAGAAMLPAGAAAAIGGIGAAVYAADKIGDFAESQRATNANWQRMQGGSNADAFGERARSKMFQYSQFGVLGDQDAARLYEGVASTGMDRGQRDAAQQFAVENYKDLGMTIDQSMEIVKTASKTGQESLTGIADALRDVTDSAKSAGVNTEVARQKFVDTWQSFSEVLSGPAAVTTAAGFTAAQNGMGRKFEGLSFDVTGEQQSAGLLGPQSMALLAEAQRRNGGKPLSGPQLQKLKVQMLEQDPTMDVPTLTRVMEQTTGVHGLSPEKALEYAINLQTGEFDPGKKVKQQVARSKTSTIDASKDNLNWGMFNPFGDLKEAGYSDEYNSLADKVNAKRSGWKWGDRDARGVSDAYLDSVRDNGRVGGISQALATSDDNGLGMAKKVRVKVGGGTRVVSLEDAMRDFRDQIDRGTAVIAEGEAAGSTVAEATNLLGDKSVEVTSRKNKDLADKGESYRDWAKDQGGKGGKGGGSVTISPSPELMRYLRFSTSGGASLDPSSALIPPSPYTTADGRPSG